MQECLTAKNKKTNIETFTDYRPHFVEQTSILTQFACENCLKSDNAKAALNGSVTHIHKCGTSECPNWTAPNGPNCDCDQCKECNILKYCRSDPFELVKKLCCHPDQNHLN